MDIGEVKNMLTKLAERECWCDDNDFMIDDYTGGNIDDAYYGGSNDGETLLARELLVLLFGEEKGK